MKLTVYHDKENNIIVTTPVGVITMENVISAAKQAMELSNKLKCNSLLFDIRKCPAEQSLLEGYKGMQNISQSIGISIKHRIAIVYNPEIYPEERAMFIENVVTNRANPKFKMFKSLPEALNWIYKYESKKENI